MRLAVLISAIALLAPVGAHADTFTFVPDNGDPTITFSVPDTASPSYVGLGQAFNYTVLPDSSSLIVATFLNAAYVATEGGGVGNNDFYLLNFSNSVEREYLVDGIQLYTGSEADPTLISGTYDLTADPIDQTDSYYRNTGGVLTISDGSAVAMTPEPSSIALLGSGVLGMAGMVRRRFVA